MDVDHAEVEKRMVKAGAAVRRFATEYFAAVVSLADLARQIHARGQEHLLRLPPCERRQLEHAAEMTSYE